MTPEQLAKLSDQAMRDNKECMIFTDHRTAKIEVIPWYKEKLCKARTGQATQTLSNQGN